MDSPFTPPAFRVDHHAGPGRNCIKCGRPLTIQQSLSGKVCDDLACKGPYLQELKAIETAKRREARRRVAERVSELVDIANNAASPVEPACHRPVVLPANLNECVPLSAERLEYFRSHLRRVIAEVRPPHETVGEEQAASDAQLNAEPPPGPVIHACTTCRGRCCLGGAGHAFLRAETITGFWQRHPSMPPEAIEAEYLQHVAERGFADSCVYHSASGCTLPRDMRADICNTFLCEGLLEGLEPGPEPSLYIAADGADVHRAVLVDSNGLRRDVLPENRQPSAHP